MGRRTVLGGMIVAAAMVGPWAATAGAAPWEDLFTLRRVEADPAKPYRLQEENGPWLIKACSFSSDGAEEQAHQLVMELRQRYKLEAYVHRMQFDFDEGVSGRGLNRYGEPAQWRYQRDGDAEEIAVLVGDFSSVDDPAAKATLRTIKYAKPDCLDTEGGKKTNQTLAGLRRIQKQLLKGNNEKKKRGPMGQAFLVPNPMHKGQTAPARGLDPLVVNMNKGLKYSLLDCKGKYTVQVAHFTGKVIVDQAEIQRIQNGETDLEETRLDEAAEKAHKLTLALRAKGYEAYEFHEKFASIVTVGSFDMVGTPRPDGKTEIHPQIYRIMETFKGRPIAGGGPVGAQLVSGIALDIQPRPVLVPRESIGAAQARHMAGLW